MGDGVFPVDIVAVVGREQRRVQLPRDIDQPRVRAPLLVEPVVLQLDEEVVPPEDVLQPTGELEGQLLLTVQERLEDDTAEASRGRDDAFVVLLEQLPVDSRFVEIAGEEGVGRQLDEVPVAGVVLGERGQVVVELLPLLPLPTGVVEAAAANGTFEARLARLVQLAADDGFDALGPRLLVEVEDAVHVRVVSDADGPLAVGHGSADDLVDAGRPVEHRELSVQVEVRNGVAAAAGTSHRNLLTGLSTGGLWTELHGWSSPYPATVMAFK